MLVRLNRKRLLLAATLGLALAPCAAASTVLLTATAQGWVTATRNNGAFADNSYLAGNCGAGDCYTGEFRNFFQFGIPKLDGLVLSATLLLDTRYEALRQSPSIAYQVTSAGPDLGFSDLGVGTLYGSRTYTAADQYQVEGIALDAAALAAIQEAAGGTFVLGGRVTSAALFSSTQPDQLVFGRSDAPQQLQIVTASAPMMLLSSQSAAPAPEPASAVLLGAGGLLVTLRRRR
jgi:hypothetical protein